MRRRVICARDRGVAAQTQVTGESVSFALVQCQKAYTRNNYS